MCFLLFFNVKKQNFLFKARFKIGKMVRKTANSVKIKKQEIEKRTRGRLNL